MATAKKLTEADVNLAVLQVLAHSPNGRADVRSIVKAFPQYVKLEAVDKVRSDTRPGEELWEQQVRNLKSHDKTPGNIFAEGLAAHVSKGVWEITDAGRLHLKHAGLHP